MNHIGLFSILVCRLVSLDVVPKLTVHTHTHTLTFNILDRILIVPFDDTASIAPADLKGIAPRIVQLSVWGAVRISGVVASFHPGCRVPITNTRSKPFWYAVVLPRRMILVGFARVVVVPVMLLAVSVFSVFPVTPGQL